MSYCVNCGVKLKNSEKSCPLCNTIVINPNNKDDVYEPAYPNIIENFSKLNFNFIAKLVIVVLLILTLVTVICNILIAKRITWSIYVIASTLYVSSHLSILLRKSIFIPLTIEFVSLELLIFVIAYLNNGMHWFLYLVFPFIMILWIYIMLCTYLIKKRKKSVLRRIATCIIFSAVALMVIESCIDLFRTETISLKWSIYAAQPIVIISILIYVLSFHKKLLNEIKQRIFI